MTAHLFTQPGCGACTFAAKDLERAGIEYELRDVRADSSAAAELVDLYAELRPGMVPTTPVVMICGEALFGAVELHEHLRCLAKAVAA